MLLVIPMVVHVAVFKGLWIYAFIYVRKWVVQKLVLQRHIADTVLIPFIDASHFPTPVAICAEQEIKSGPSYVPSWRKDKRGSQKQLEIATTGKKSNCRHSIKVSVCRRVPWRLRVKNKISLRTCNTPTPSHELNVRHHQKRHWDSKNRRHRSR